MYIDTHAHIYGKEFEDDLDAVIARAKETGAVCIFMPATDEQSADEVMRLSKLYEGFLYPMIGLHPEDLPDDYVDDNPENDAVSYVQQAKAFSEDAEAWAKGTRAGADVESGADQYHNNSKYYTQQAQQAAAKAETNAETAETAKEDAERAAGAAAAIVEVATNGMVIVDDETKYVVTHKVKGEHLVATLTATA